MYYTKRITHCLTEIQILHLVFLFAKTGKLIPGLGDHKDKGQRSGNGLGLSAEQKGQRVQGVGDVVSERKA